MDARLTWTSADNRNRIILYGKNIFDQIGYDGGALGSRFAGFIVSPAGLASLGAGVTPVNEGSTRPIR